jgi:Kef-type K+ transport system membrane component KefB
MTYTDATLKLLLQLSIILFACQITCYIGKRFLAQSSVVGEMVAGVLLGPSLGYFLKRHSCF